MPNTITIDFATVPLDSYNLACSLADSTRKRQMVGMEWVFDASIRRHRETGAVLITDNYEEIKRRCGSFIHVLPQK
jgi:hypothetical protein